MLRLIKDVVMDRRICGLCVRPYPGHPRGCPNFNKKKGCPPKVPALNDVIDLRESVYAIWNCFPLGAHVRKMKARHPTWSDRQLYCCLYWQGTARTQLRLMTQDALRRNPTLTVVRCPEAHGVNVTATMASVGVELQWPPREWAYQVVLMGHKC